ncbi:MAG: branched-chain amino acid transport system II carrier protein, partial [Megasphaera lornae]
MGEKKNVRTISIGLMLFALFFGAGNLIFPAAMGQHAGVNVWWAVLGFIVTGVGLPLLGVLAMGYSGCKNLQELAGRVHPKFGLFFTVLSFITIGPAFATPRTGSVSYEIAVRPFLANGGSHATMIGFLVLFFLVSFWLSASPQKLVDRIGKILTPALLVVI